MFNLRKPFAHTVLLPVVCLPFIVGSLKASGQDQDVDESSIAIFSGMIKDTEGNPVDDAQIILIGESIFTARVDDFGVFVFSGPMKSGDYRVLIQSSKCVGLTESAKLPVVSIVAEEPSVKNFQLRKACQVELKVVDERGDPVVCTVYHMPLGRDHYNAVRSETKTDGVVVIGGIDPEVGRYQLGINSERHALARLEVNETDTSQISKYELVLKEGKSVSGTVLCSDQQPAAGWEMCALPTWWNFGQSPMSDTIGDDGSFELNHIGEGPYNVVVYIPLGDRRSSSAVVASDIDLAATSSALNLTVDHPSPKSMRYLEGTVRWVGSPINEPLQIRLSGSSAARRTFNFTIAAGSHDFRVGPVPQGDYRVGIEAPEFEVLNLARKTGLSDLSSVSIPNEEKLEIVLKQSSRPLVTAVVVDAKTGEKIERFRYRIRKIRATRGTNFAQPDDWFVGRDGAIIKEVVGPGIYDVSILADGFAISTSEEVNTDEPPEEGLSVALSPGVPLSGSIVDSDGQPINNAKVRVLSLSEGTRPSSRSQFVSDIQAQKTQAGKFHFQHLRPGTDSLRIEHPDYPFKVVSGIEIKEGSEPLKIMLPSGGTVYGTVLDEEGKPLPNVGLNFHRDSRYEGGLADSLTLFGRTVTDEDGNYSIDKLPLGKVYVSQNDFLSKMGMVKQLVVVADGQRHQVNLGGTSRLSGTLTSSGKPLANKRLQLTGTDYMFGAMKFTTTTDSDGRYTFLGAARGHWNLYRDLETRRGEWAPVMELDVVGKDVDLGTTDLQIGSLTVDWKHSTGEAIPEGSSLRLSGYSESSYFGLSIAILKPRTSDKDPFEFTGVSPGNYQFVGSVNGIQYTKKITLTKSDINSTVEFVLPKGDSELAFELRERNGDLVDTVNTLVSEDQSIFYYLTSRNRDAAGVHKLKGLPTTKFELRQGYTQGTPVITKLQSVVVPEGESPTITKVVIPDRTSDQFGMAKIIVVDENGVYVPVRLNAHELSVIKSEDFHVVTGPPGEHRILIEQPGFEPYEGTIKLVTATQITKAAASTDPEKRGEFAIHLKSE